MSEAYPKEVRLAARDAIMELSDRLMRGASSLLRKSAFLMDPDPKVHGRAVTELRRYQGFEMPGSEEVRKIEAALIGKTEAESRKLAEERRLERCKRKREDRKVREAAWQERWDEESPSVDRTIRCALEHAGLLSEAVAKLNDRYSEGLAKKLAACLDPEMADALPFTILALELRPLKSRAKRKKVTGENVVEGPWDNGGAQ